MSTWRGWEFWGGREFEVTGSLELGIWGGEVLEGWEFGGQDFCGGRNSAGNGNFGGGGNEQGLIPAWKKEYMSALLSPHLGTAPITPPKGTSPQNGKPVSPSGTLCNQWGPPDGPPQRWDGIDPRRHFLTPADLPLAPLPPLAPDEPPIDPSNPLCFFPPSPSPHLPRKEPLPAVCPHL